MRRGKPRGHYCRICGRRRPNEAFSGNRHARHICRECAKLPQEKIRHIEETEEVVNFLDQSNISKKNIVRLTALAASADPEVARISKVVLEIGEVHPRKRKRTKFLARYRRDLIAGLAEFGLAWIVEVEEESDEEMDEIFCEYEETSEFFEQEPTDSFDLPF